MTLSPEIQRMLDESERTRQKRAADRRLDWFADHGSDIPDLEFETPICPCCGLHTDADDGSFLCDGCRIVWRSNGYGHQAERWTDA